MKVLIIGASGVLGSRLYNDIIKKKWNVLGTYYSHRCEGLFYLDLTDKKTINKIFHFFKPEVVIISGGLTDVDLCELKPKLAEDINIKGTINVIKKTKEYDAKLVYLSTDYVFDGENGPYSEDDKPHPINVYGRTKLEAEEVIKSSFKEFLIIRTSQLYGLDVRKKNFAVKIIYNMKDNKKIYAADDFYSTPTYVGSLSDIILNLIEKENTGLYNGAGMEFIDRYTYVKTIARVFNLDTTLIERVKLKDLKLKAKRPQKGGLKVDKIIIEKITKLYDYNHNIELLRRDLGI